ncbi:unnamed protein product, partial [Toxocara canis]|uniref:Ig-like domain-containing protein n=1 Tax=Toxocara canis TaxID=6265 RepID=A0A183UXE2_TOXCA
DDRGSKGEEVKWKGLWILNSRLKHSFQDGVPLTLTPNTELSEDSTQLKIHSSKLHDEGLYSCVAMNPAGNATQKQQLYVGGMYSLLALFRKKTVSSIFVQEVCYIKSLLGSSPHFYVGLLNTL